MQFILPNSGQARKTLAEIAETKEQTSIDSDVFMKSLNSSTTFHEMTQVKGAVPQFTIDNDTDTEDSSQTSKNSFKLIDFDDNNLATSSSVQSFRSTLSGSSQNLLNEEYNSQDDILEPRWDITNPPNEANQDTDSALTSNDSASITEETTSKQLHLLSPHDSVASDPDLINFEHDASPNLSKPVLTDAQSIDSHMFLLIDSDDFKDLKSSREHVEGEELTETDEESGEKIVTEEAPLAHVRFAEGRY